MNQRLFHGSYGIILTPFLENGNVDFPMLLQQVDRVCNSKIDGIVACGSTGEFAQLDVRTNMRIMREVSAVNHNRKKLICGATAADYRTSIQYLECMADIGADGALVAPPYYFPLGDEDVVEFYRRINNENHGVPILAYHIPQFTNGISLNSFIRILEFENIKGIKNSSGDFNYMMQLLSFRNLYRPDLSVLTGSDETILPTLMMGGDGNLTAFTYLLPELVSVIYQYQENAEKAASCQMALLPLLKLAGSVTFPFGYKLVGKAAGFDFEYPRQAIPFAMMEKGRKLEQSMKQIIQILMQVYSSKNDACV